MQAGELRSYITLYKKKKTQNELGEDSYDYAEDRKMWAKITPSTGKNSEYQGNTEINNISHKIRIRTENVKHLAVDAYFMYKGQRYNIDYWQPVYNNTAFTEVMCTMEVMT